MNLVKIIILLLGLMSSLMSFGQPLDVLYFKKGKVMKGRVMEYRSGEYLSLLKSGKKIEYSGDSFKNIRKVKLSEGDYHLKEKGSWYELNAGVMTGRAGIYSENQIRPTVELIGGYRMNRYLGLGIGTGYQNYEGIDIIPIYLTVTGDFLDERITPYYFLNTGYGFGLNRMGEFDNNNKVKGGLMYNLGIGVKYRLKGKYLTTCVAYRFQAARFVSEQEVNTFSRIDPLYYFPYKRNQHFNRLEFKLGIGI